VKDLSIDGQVALRGRAPAHASRRNKVYEDGRVCSAHGCETRLSVYNASTECWQHTEVRPFILQVPRRRRKAREPRIEAGR
jgi:hypothetical protein